MYEVVLKKSYITMVFAFELIADATDFIQIVLDRYEDDKKEKLSVSVRRAVTEEEEKEEE